MGFTERGIVESEEPGFLRLSFFDELGVRHAFSTRKGGVSVPPYHSLNLGLSVGDNPAAVRENRRRYFSVLGLDPSRIVRVRQVHGNDVLVVDPGLAGREQFPRLLVDDDYLYDAMVTDVPGFGLTISTADCLPSFLADPRRRVIGAVHAGWRGWGLGGGGASHHQAEGGLYSVAGLCETDRRGSLDVGPRSPEHRHPGRDRGQPGTRRGHRPLHRVPQRSLLLISGRKAKDGPDDERHRPPVVTGD